MFAYVHNDVDTGVCERFLYTHLYIQEQMKKKKNATTKIELTPQRRRKNHSSICLSIDPSSAELLVTIRNTNWCLCPHTSMYLCYREKKIAPRLNNWILPRLYRRSLLLISS